MFTIRDGDTNISEPKQSFSKLTSFWLNYRDMELLTQLETTLRFVGFLYPRPNFGKGIMSPLSSI